MSSACLACHCAISTPFTGTRTIGVTGGTTDPALAICARLSMYCRQSRSLPLSHGLMLHLEHAAVVFRGAHGDRRVGVGGRKACQRMLAGFECADDII
jgi:hypothetical protein